MTFIIITIIDLEWTEWGTLPVLYNTGKQINQEQSISRNLHLAAARTLRTAAATRLKAQLLCKVFNLSC